MKYYGIVSEINEEQKSGVYGRILPQDKDLKSITDDLQLDWIDGLTIVASLINPYARAGTAIAFTARKAYKYITKNRKLELIAQFSSEPQHKMLVIQDKLLDDNYNLDDDYSYGLLDDFVLKDSAFKAIMKSKGGSSVIILERNDMPSNLKHYGGENGRFSEGLYVGHPKDENILLPLNNFKNLVQSLVLEEVVSTYADLGAKSIIIEDVFKIDANVDIDVDVPKEGKGESDNIKGGAKFNYSKEILREKHFGEGIFNPERALDGKLFISDIPFVKTVVNSRIDGNQLIDNFTETINLGMGLDLKVLEMLNASSSFDFIRKWKFTVEFYDKNTYAKKTYTSKILDKIKDVF